MSIFKTKRPTPAENLQHIARITASVAELEKNKTIRIVGNTVYLFRVLWPNKKIALSWIKNLYIVCAATRGHSKEQVLYFKDIETDDILGFYKDGAATAMI